MLEDFSQHILDIAENSINADATEVKISMLEDIPAGFLTFRVDDNGKGMDRAMLLKVTDPFCTTRTTRKVGLGIPFLKQIAELCGGNFYISSKLGKGTSLYATFCLDSIDIPPMGDIPSSIMTLLAAHPEIRWIYIHRRGGASFELDSSEIIDILGDPLELDSPKIAVWIKSYIGENLEALGR